MVGRQTPFLALIIPFVLVFMTDGRRGLRETWPAALTAGFVFAFFQYGVSNYVNVQLTDIIAALASAAAVVALLRVWSPGGAGAPAGTAGGQRPAIAGGAVSDPALERRLGARRSGGGLSRAELLMAFAPYIIIVDRARRDEPAPGAERP